MATYKIEASWNYAAEGRVDYSFSRRDPSAGVLAHSGYAWTHLGDTQGPLCTATEAEQLAMTWLTEQAGMTDADSTRMHLFATGAIEQIEALAAAAR